VKHTEIGALLLALVAGACAGPEEEGAVNVTSPAAGSSESMTTIYWSDQEDGRPVIRQEQITRAQADDLLARRAANKAARLAGKPEHRGQALTLGSTSWMDCQFYEWFLVTSGQDQSGQIFCTKWGGSGAPWSIELPWIPAYYDRSTSFINTMCSDSASCGVWDCGPGSNNVRVFYPNQTPQTENYMPPSKRVFIVSQASAFPC